MLSPSPMHSPVLVSAPQSPVKSITPPIFDETHRRSLGPSFVSGVSSEGEFDGREEEGMEADAESSTRGMKSPLRSAGFASSLGGYGEKEEEEEEEDEKRERMESEENRHKGRKPQGERLGDMLNAGLSPNPTINTIATTSTTAKAEKGLHVPFLPRFLKVRGSSSERAAGRESVDEEAAAATAAAPGRVEDIKSVFDDYSSDGGEAVGKKEAMAPKSRRGRSKRPMLLQQASNTVIGLREMLRSTGPAGTDQRNPGPSSQEKLARILGDEVRFSQGSNSKRSGIIGLPVAHDVVDRGVFPPEVGGGSIPEQPVGLGLGIWQSRVPSLTDGLRSHPIKRSATVPTRRRMVGFAPPADLDIRPEHKFLRQSVISTPYPPEYNSGGQSGQEAVLTLLLDSQRTSVPMIRKIVIPAVKGSILEDSSSKENTTSTATSFDDEHLFRRIRTEYRKMRGFFRNMMSARQVQGLNLVSYEKLSHLAGYNKPQRRKPFRVQYDGAFAETQLLRLFRKPNVGRGKHKWVKWAARLPVNSEGEEASRKEKVAIELVEGWSVSRIVLAMLVVISFSVVGTLLWIFLGAGSNHGIFKTSKDNSGLGGPVRLEATALGFRGASGRVEAGVTLGVLLLMLGWSGIGAWVLLSWLV